MLTREGLDPGVLTFIEEVFLNNGLAVAELLEYNFRGIELPWITAGDLRDFKDRSGENRVDKFSLIAVQTGKSEEIEGEDDDFATKLKMYDGPFRDQVVKALSLAYFDAVEQKIRNNEQLFLATKLSLCLILGVMLAKLESKDAEK